MYSFKMLVVVFIIIEILQFVYSKHEDIESENEEEKGKGGKKMSKMFIKYLLKSMSRG